MGCFHCAFTLVARTVLLPMGLASLHLSRRSRDFRSFVAGVGDHCHPMFVAFFILVDTIRGSVAVAHFLKFIFAVTSVRALGTEDLYSTTMILGRPQSHADRHAWVDHIFVVSPGDVLLVRANKIVVSIVDIVVEVADALERLSDQGLHVLPPGY
jgi:hypothetical protein